MLLYVGFCDLSSKEEIRGSTARRSSAVALAALCGIAPATAWAASRPSAPGTPNSATTTTTAASTTTTAASTTTTAASTTTTRAHAPTTVGTAHDPTTGGVSHATSTATASTSTSTTLPKPPASTPAARNLSNFGTQKDTIYVTTPEDHSIVVTVDPTVTITSTTQPLHGSDQQTGPQTILYTPNTGYVGPDNFDYAGTVSLAAQARAQAPDQVGFPVTGTVDVTVTEIPPTARNATVDTTAGKAVGVDLTALTTVTTGNTATYTVSNPAHGTVTTTSSGAATFTPAAGFTGTEGSPTPSPTTTAERRRRP